MPNTELFPIAPAPEAAGMSSAGIRAVETLLAEQFAQGLHPGAHLLVIRHGQIVLDRGIGLAHAAARRPVQPDTLWLLFSATKPYTAIAVLKLVTEGKLDLDAPIARYWPEFGQHGKVEITVRQVLTHRAGIPNGAISSQPWLWPSWRLTTRAVAAMSPEYAPGKEVAYHSVTFGWLLGELVRRVDGRSLRRYLQDELFQPLGLRHTYLGLPLRPALWRRRSVPVAVHSEKQLRQSAFVINLAAIRNAPIPAATGHATVYEHARLYQLLLDRGRWQGKQIFAPEVVDILTTPSNPDPGQMDRVLGKPTRWAHGVSLGGAPRRGFASFMGQTSSGAAFGHGGLRSLAAWADRDRQLICLYFTNGLLESEASDRRSTDMSDAVLAACL